MPMLVLRGYSLECETIEVAPVNHGVYAGRWDTQKLPSVIGGGPVWTGAYHVDTVLV